jgi:FtsZ-binding cell division protein ZapB
MSRDYAIEENVKLQSEIRTLKDEKKSLAQMLAAKDAEIERLREALTQCAEWIREKHEMPDCSEILLNARAALGQMPPEPFTGTCAWKEAATSSEDNIYNTSCGVVRRLPRDGVCPCCNRRVEVRV